MKSRFRPTHPIFPWSKIGRRIGCTAKAWQPQMPWKTTTMEHASARHASITRDLLSRAGRVFVVADGDPAGTAGDDEGKEE